MNDWNSFHHSSLQQENTPTLILEKKENGGKEDNKFWKTLFPLYNF